MKIALIAFTVALAGPAGASAWSDIACSEGIKTEGRDFTYINDGGASVLCKLTAATELTCDDGKTRQIVSLPDNELMVDNVRMYVVGPDNPAICD